jgi:hypothetical protein
MHHGRKNRVYLFYFGGGTSRKEEDLDNIHLEGNEGHGITE